MTAAAPPAWNLFKQIFADHWDGFKRAHPRYDRRYYDGLVEKMLGCGNPDQMGYIDYRCLHCGEGTHRVAMSCKSSLCLRCAKVYVDHWISQVSQMLHEGVLYRHIVLTVPEILRKTFYQQAQAVLRLTCWPVSWASGMAASMCQALLVLRTATNQRGSQRRSPQQSSATQPRWSICRWK